MELDPDISSAISLAELDSDFQPTDFQLNFDMPDLLMENDGQDGGIEAADVSSLLEQFEEGHLVQGPGHIPGPDHIDQGQGHHQCLAGLAAEVGAGVTGDAVGQEVGVQVCLDVTKSDKDLERLKEPKKWDNYGFVTFAYTCDAYAAVEKGNQVPGEQEFDLCFGGRRQFCKTEYADLDGNNEIIEEYYPLVKKSDPLDFDSLLQLARKQAEDKKKKNV
uniref:Peroxisome proliferator-activated receptor gamma coactivator-related protein 1 n=1 Tax=Magallana gigas TaxID=29159 RepID=K1RBB2_MAGGI